MTNSKEVLQEKVVVNSHLIEFMVYDKAAQRLDVKYKSGKHKGKIRTYQNMDGGSYEYILGHASPGKALASVLKKKRKESPSFWVRLSSIFNIF